MDNGSSINFVNGDVKIPVRILNIFNEKEELIEETKMKELRYKKTRWLKFNVQSVVPKNDHYDAGYELFLCLPDSSKCDFHETDLIKLIKNCCTEKVNLILECITHCGESIPGLFTPLSAEAAIISVLYPQINHLQLKSNFENYAAHILNFQDALMDTNLFDADNCKVSLNVSSLNKGNAEKLENIFLKPFQMECLEKWFKPTSKPNLESYVQSRSSKETSKVKPFYKMLQQFARNSKNLNSKSSRKNLSSINVEENICSTTNNEKKEEKSPGSLSCPESEDIKLEESDFSYEELLSVLNKEYDAALESGNIVAASKRIVKMVINFYKKRDNSNLEDDVQNLFRDSFILTDRKIIEKYEMLETDEAKKKKIKECQIQVLLILEIENSKQCPDRSNCVDTVSPLLRLIIFWSGIEESENFMQEILLKNYSHQLYDVLVEIGEEVGLSKSFLDDAESINSPTDTVSSEIMNDEEIFSSAISSNISEKSSSSICSRKDKENNNMERKLLRRRSDISIVAGVRQVVLPKSSSKKRKRKAAANKVVRCSPRIASMKKEQLSRSLSEKPRTVRRNLFPGSGQTPKKNKNNQPNTPKSKKKENQLTKTKYVAETPSHKQNHSALQRRKSLIDKTSDSPKVINESPQIVKTVTDATNKELLERLQKARLNLLKPAVPSSQKSRSPNFTQYTPESKRRLSLKLFSNFLASPTARMGIKKCTKRLFDQISPKKDDNSNNKKHKPNDDCE